jgi:hypothetical protein
MALGRTPFGTKRRSTATSKGPGGVKFEGHAGGSYGEARSV